MTDTQVPTTVTNSVRLLVPELVERPIVGGGCCGIAATEMVADSVGRIPGVVAVSCDDAKGVVAIEFGDDPNVPSVASAMLDSLGYSVTSIEA